MTSTRCGSIGGPPRCGKTTLARLLAGKYGLPYFSIDHVASVIPPYIDPQRQDESFPLRAARRKANNDNDVFFGAHSAAEVVGMDRRQAATCWPGIKGFIDYAIRDEHDLILEGWQLLHRFLEEVPLAKSPDNIQVRYLYKTDVAEILAGLKASHAENDWVLRNTSSGATFERIARMISVFGEGIRNESGSAGFEAANIDFVRKMSEISDGLVGPHNSVAREQ